MICYHCNKVIIPENGYFTAWVRGIRMDFCIHCRPTFFYRKD